MAERTLYDALGGETVLGPIIHDFVTRMCDDVMIGFFFDGVDRAHLERMERLFTAKFLGADVEYPGRALGAAHRPHPIMGGQFDRRKQLLREAIDRAGVSAPIRDAWLQHVEDLRATITKDARGECVDPEPRPPRFRIKP